MMDSVIAKFATFLPSANSKHTKSPAFSVDIDEGRVLNWFRLQKLKRLVLQPDVSEKSARWTVTP